MENTPPLADCQHDVLVTLDGKQAEPSDTWGPASRLFYAKCLRCGSRYDGPWRLKVLTTGN